MTCASCQADFPSAFPFCPHCGAKSAAIVNHEPDDPIRVTLRRALGEQYEVQRLLGRGGVGAVYLAKR